MTETRPHTGNGLQRGFRRIADRGVGGRLPTIDLQRETSAVLGHDEALHQTGGDQPWPDTGSMTASSAAMTAVRSTKAASRKTCRR